MTQSTLDKRSHPPANPEPTYKVGETGDTVVYIFPSGNACVKKGAKKARQSESAPTANVSASVPPKPPAPPRPPAPKPPVAFRQPTPPKPPAPSSSSASAPQSVGDRLVQSGLISANQLQVALYDQQSMNLELVEVLIARGWLDEAQLEGFLSV
ncbi:MAG: hypothetical protein AB4042_01080 [Leptolyngbyaceae cyanobacterium]